MTNIQLANLINKLIDLFITKAISNVEIQNLVDLRDEIFFEK